MQTLISITYTNFKWTKKSIFIYRYGQKLIINKKSKDIKLIIPKNTTLLWKEKHKNH